jgi:hypothetical protein
MSDDEPQKIYGTREQARLALLEHADAGDTITMCLGPPQCGMEDPSSFYMRTCKLCERIHISPAGRA